MADRPNDRFADTVIVLLLGTVAVLLAAQGVGFIVSHWGGR